MTKTFDGQLEIDASRGVIYFHDKKSATILRICRLESEMLKKMVDKGGQLDITHLKGACVS